MSTKKEAACYSVRAGAVAGGWCRPSWTRGAAAAEGFQLFDFQMGENGEARERVEGGVAALRDLGLLLAEAVRR